MIYIKPKKKWGQNFLIDKNICNKIVSSLELKSNDSILEIGPGKGAITNLLTQKALKVVAIEIDNNLCEILNQKNISNLKVINEDILKTNIKGYTSRIIVGNLPYYITTPIIFNFFESNKAWEEMYFLMQKEVAERIVAKPGSKTYGRLSIMTQIFSTPKILFNVSPNVFRPIPKVKSSFVCIKKDIHKDISDYDRFKNIIRMIFNKRRKKLKNCITEEMNLNIKSNSELLNRRPEEISIEEYIEIIN
tara:strand:- start:124 stop:867 length:744 start_codon:yes stop_codon:yes gene_type:complete